MGVSVLVYGAGGAGRSLCAALAAAGLNVELAGRSPERVGAVARDLGVPYRIADLRDRVSVLGALDGVHLVINAAGPFARTAPPLLSAALTAGVHYLDLSNEYSSHTHAWFRHRDAVARQTAIVCGSGFGGTAAGLAALRAVAEVPDAHSLDILFVPRGSSGTAGVLRSTLSLVAGGGRGLLNGTLRRLSVRRFARAETLPNGDVVSVAPVSTGDLVSIARGTRVPNVMVFTPVRVSLRVLRVLMPPLSVLLRPGWVREAVVAAVMRRKGRAETPVPAPRMSYAQATATDTSGRSHTAVVAVPHTRDFMAAVCLALIEEVRGGDVAGCHTPAQVLGRDRLDELVGRMVQT
ncbi:saccharopine dehydrogenase NADP-binding domain-containing protein [Klugiella xanthotipulae]|uniref:Short subunit dehydrogenase-like uncharacterized protein n=1 Tax=Klugiella xanthotipulae TaxID=244735 RepID=A0A543I4D2_9MICO|nr:saccharopine dehydrogenase NADP-binding domain-containing protein [Klugiella xanthotipulae]TQM65452.1 short subunit dehydrogenase-like uncharacterized protein [Klugiella xanthotipulae]